MNPKHLVAPAIAVVIGLSATGCSQKYGAERDGKKAGEAICDVRDADSPDAAKSALAEVKNQLGDLANKHAMYTSEDRRDIQNNLADLHEHAIQGNTALIQQDLAVLRRSIVNVSDDSDEVASAAWEGVLEGLSDCVD